MASPDRVKQYLALWFQLGKQVSVANGQSYLCPSHVSEGDRYSPEFEAIWQRILTAPGTAYLEGTHQTIQELLSSQWDIVPCARCSMDVPLSYSGTHDAGSCPCADLPNWPNTEIPLPRPPVNTGRHLNRIYERLQADVAAQSEPRS